METPEEKAERLLNYIDSEQGIREETERFGEDIADQRSLIAWIWWRRVRQGIRPRRVREIRKDLYHQLQRRR